MAKKTTAKKKPAAKKKTAAEKKTGPKGRSGSKSEGSASMPKGESGKAGKTAAQKKLSPKDLIGKKFGTWKPETLFVPAPARKKGKGFEAPPFGKNIRKDILMRKFDFDFADVSGVSAREQLIGRKLGMENRSIFLCLRKIRFIKRDLPLRPLKRESAGMC
ncbi:MAG: hypothetical protein R2941_05685 [Desulfobacterales bacterium]